MPSFINLLENDVWSEADIINKTEAELHSVCSKTNELILSRKMIGFSLGRMIPTAQEQAELTAYEIAAYQAQQSGIAARADMVRLQAALDYERAHARLALPIPQEGDTAADAEERSSAQAIVNAATSETLELVALRNPPVTP